MQTILCYKDKCIKLMIKGFLLTIAIKVAKYILYVTQKVSQYFSWLRQSLYQQLLYVID